MDRMDHADSKSVQPGETPGFSARIFCLRALKHNRTKKAWTGGRNDEAEPYGRDFFSEGESRAGAFLPEKRGVFSTDRQDSPVACARRNSSWDPVNGISWYNSQDHDLLRRIVCGAQFAKQPGSTMAEK